MRPYVFIAATHQPDSQIVLTVTRVVDRWPADTRTILLPDGVSSTQGDDVDTLNQQVAQARTLGLAPATVFDLPVHGGDDLVEILADLTAQWASPIIAADQAVLVMMQQAVAATRPEGIGVPVMVHTLPDWVTDEQYSSWRPGVQYPWELLAHYPVLKGCRGGWSGAYRKEYTQYLLAMGAPEEHEDPVWWVTRLHQHQPQSGHIHDGKLTVAIDLTTVPAWACTQLWPDLPSPDLMATTEAIPDGQTIRLSGWFPASLGFNLSQWAYTHGHRFATGDEAEHATWTLYGFPVHTAPEPDAGAPGRQVAAYPSVHRETVAVVDTPPSTPAPQRSWWARVLDRPRSYWQTVRRQVAGAGMGATLGVGAVASYLAGVQMHYDAAYVFLFAVGVPMTCGMFTLSEYASKREHTTSSRMQTAWLTTSIWVGMGTIPAAYFAASQVVAPALQPAIANGLWWSLTIGLFSWLMVFNNRNILHDPEGLLARFAHPPVFDGPKLQWGGPRITLTDPAATPTPPPPVVPDAPVALPEPTPDVAAALLDRQTNHEWKPRNPARLDHG